MRQFTMALTAFAAFGAMVATAQAENQTPSPPTASHAVKKRTVSPTARPSSRAEMFVACQEKAADIGLATGQAGRTQYIAECMGICRGGQSYHRYR
jgi:hypothetical protein